MLREPYVDCHVVHSSNTKEWWAAENATSSLLQDQLNGFSIKALTTSTARPSTDLGGASRQLNQSSGRRKFESPSQLVARASELIPLAHQNRRAVTRETEVASTPFQYARPRERNE